MARKSFFGRLVDKVKSIFVEEPKPTPPPKPAPKKVPTTRPQRPQQTEAQRKANEERARARKRAEENRQKKRDKLYNHLYGYFGDRRNDYGELTWNPNEVNRRIKKMPIELVDEMLLLTTEDAINEAYADSQTEFSGYDQPQGFWYH